MPVSMYCLESAIVLYATILFTIVLYNAFHYEARVISIFAES